MEKRNPSDPPTDAVTEYDLMAAYYRDIGTHHSLTAEEEQQYSKDIWQGFAEIIHTICRSSGTIEDLRKLKKKIKRWQLRDASLKPKQQLLNEIRQDVSDICKTMPARDVLKNLQREIEAQYQKIDSARDIMIRANLPLVIATAKQYRKHSLSFNDLVQEGNIGLMRAVLRFDHRKGFRFSTYATWWIKQSISKALVDKGREIRLPYHFNELSKKYFRVFHAKRRDLGRIPTLREMSLATEIPEKDLLLIIESAMEPLSLESPVDEDSGTLMQLLEDERTESPYHQTFLRERRHRLSSCLSVLTERQRNIVCLRFGLEGQGGATLQEIGDNLQVTRECVRQTEVRALRCLRMSQHADEMRGYRFG